METTDQILALSQDSFFRQRMRGLMLFEAAAVAAEAATVPNHNPRVAYAFKIIASPGEAERAVDYLSIRPALLNSVVTFNFSRRSVDTDATDTAIRTQIQSDWNTLSGISA